MNCLPAIKKQFLNVLMYSGKGIMKIGSYGSCVEKQGMDYKLISFEFDNVPDTPLFSGLCLPSECTGNQLMFTLKQIIKLTKLPISYLSVDEKIPEQTFAYNWGFYFLILLLSLLVMLFVVSSLSKTVGKHHTLSVFSFQNSNKIFKYKENDLNVLNGVKSLCMLWVIFGHEYSLGFTGNKNIQTIQIQTNKLFYLLVEAALWAVDTFFFVGGFLVAYAVLKQSSTSVLKYPLAILNRYLRFFPSYFVAILVYYSVFIHLGSGPIWAQNVPAVNFCSRMWKSLLFVDNLVDNGETMCMGWGWYLQNDMQIFVYCILILLTYNYSKIHSYFMIYFSIIASFAFNMYQTYENKYHNATHLSQFGNFQNYMLDLYIKPWARCPPYLYGLFLGIMYTSFIKKEQGNIFQKLKDTYLRKKWTRILTQLIGLCLGIFLVVIPRTNQNLGWSQLCHSLFLTYGKTLFVVAVSLIILPSLLGVKSFVRSILDTKFFNFIGKISFWTYLIHLTIMSIWISSVKIDGYFAIIPTYSLFVAHSLVSMLFGYIFMILVEIPCMKLQKKYMNKLLSSSSQKQKVKIDQLSEQKLNQKSG